jgi:hypothetical protein
MARVAAAAPHSPIRMPNAVSCIPSRRISARMLPRERDRRCRRRRNREGGRAYSRCAVQAFPLKRGACSGGFLSSNCHQERRNGRFRPRPGEVVRGYLDAMFSIEHRDNLANGCPMTASASEIARQGPVVAASFTRAFKERVTGLEASIKGRMSADQRRQLAVAALAAQIGAIAVARAVAKVDASLSKEVLQAVRKTVSPRGLLTGNVKRSRTVRPPR